MCQKYRKDNDINCKYLRLKQKDSYINYSFLSFLLAWIFPTKEYRTEFRTLCKQSNDIRLIPKRKKEYIELKNKLYKKLQKEPLRVLFLVNEIAKWKAQSLYDLMKDSKEFEPIIALTIADFQVNLSVDKKQEILYKNKEFFDQKNMYSILAYDINKNKSIDLQVFNPDIVFFQEPWSLYDNQTSRKVSKYALTCYIPYYVLSYGAEMDYNMSFHKFLHKYYILNSDWAQLFSKKLKYRLGSILPCGHTTLDSYSIESKCPQDNCIIYAPHWSVPSDKFENFENFSTFMQTGYQILNYAKEHKNIKWVFKPHPTLKNQVVKIGAMTEEEINNYYEEWNNIGTVSLDSDYKKIFDNSKLMITDCCSFLTEYFATGKPLIHLISSKRKISPMPPMGKMFDCFYKAYDLEEMFDLFEKLIIKNEDSLKGKRLKTLKSLNLCGNNASQNIFDDLIKTVKGGK